MHHLLFQNWESPDVNFLLKQIQCSPWKIPWQTKDACCYRNDRLLFLAGIQQAESAGSACWSSRFLKCKKCLLIPLCREKGCAAFAALQHPWCRLYPDDGSGWETVLPLSSGSSRKYCIKFPQALSESQPSFAKKTLKDFILKNFSVAIIVLISAASATWWWPGCCISLHLGERILLLLLYREDLKSRIKCLLQCFNGAEMNSELWSYQTLTNIPILSLVPKVSAK